MKYTLVTAATIMFAATAATAGATAINTPSGRSIWQGDVFITQTSISCTSDQGKVGRYGQVLFEPKGWTGNSSKNDLLVIFPMGGLKAIQWTPLSPTGQFSGGKSVTETTIDFTGLNTDTQYVSVTPLAPTPTPANVGDSVVQISARQTLSHGCIVTFSGRLLGPF